MKERLIELLDNATVEKTQCYPNGIPALMYCEKAVNRNTAIQLADKILADGWIRPPCKAGSTVYVIYDKKVYEAIAEQVTVVSHISGNNIIKIKAEFDVEDWFYNDGRKTKYGIYGYYQENVFLTKEEAEQKLVNINDGERNEE